MSTVLCPRLVALDPSVCNSVSCKASHTHEPAFCDPCKAVHAAVHAGIHVASIGHRLRVDGPVAPVRCIVCAPLPGPPSAQFLFIGPEHYAAHARTSAHRAKLASLPPAVRSKTKPDFGLGLGRPGDARPFSYTRSSSAGNPYSPPASRNVTPTPGASRPGSSMSFSSTSQQFGEIPPGPTPMSLEPNEYVICALCHTVLPVPSDVADVPEPGQRNVSGGSDATVRGRDDDDVGSVVTTTENDTEVRKSLVLANHMSTDNEHARRVKFPKFRVAYEKRIARERKEHGEDERREAPAPPVIEFGSRLTETPVPMTRSPDQVSLSSLSSSPSVGVTGLDPAPPAGGSGGLGGGSLFFHHHYRHRRAASQDTEREPEPKYKFSRDEDYVMQRARSRSRYETSSNGSSERAVVSASNAPRINTRMQTMPGSVPAPQPKVGIEPPAYVRDNNLPITIPEHLLPYLSPVTPSTATPEEELERYGRSPTSEYFRALPIEAMETPIRTTFMYQLPAAQAQTSTSSESSATPERSLQPIPEQPTPAESVQLSPTSSSIRSRPYEPSPSPPPRLAFDDRGNVIKLGSLGWERETGLLYDDQDEEDARPKRTTSAAAPQIPLLGLGLGPRAPSPSPSPPPIQRSASQPAQRSVSQPAPVPHSASVQGLVPAPPSDSESDEDEPPAKEEKSVVSGSVGSVKVQRYALEREPARDPLGLSRSGSERSVPSRSSTLSPPAPVRPSVRPAPAPVRSSTQVPARASPGRSSLDQTRASTLGPNRSSTTFNRTTTATRPVAPRTSTGQWSLLESGGTSGVDEFGARSSFASGSARQVASLGARPTDSWSSGLFNRSPSPLFDTSRPSSSASEASQIIRAFDSPPLDLNLGTPDMLSPKPRKERSPSPSPSPEPSSPEKSIGGHTRQASLSTRSGPSPVPRSNGSSPAPAMRIPASKLMREPKPSRPFSPTGAWNGLTPASDSSRSSSPSLGEFEGREQELARSFDGLEFLNDIRSKMTMAIESRMSSPSTPVIGGSGAGMFGQESGETEVPVLGRSISSPAAPGRSSSPAFGRPSSPALGGRSTPPLGGRSTPPISGRFTPPLGGRSTPPLVHRSSSPLARVSSPSPERSTPGRSTPTPTSHVRSSSTPSPHGKSTLTSPSHGKSTSTSPLGKPTSNSFKGKSPQHGRSTPTPVRPPLHPPRISSPLAIKTGPSVRPISPGPRTGVSDYSVAGRTRRRTRPMGTGSVVGGGSVVGSGEENVIVFAEGSVVGDDDESVVGGREESVVGGREESVVGGSEAGARAESTRTEEASEVESDSVLPVSQAEASYDATTRDDPTESPVDEFGSLLPQASTRPASGSAFERPTPGSVIDSPASMTALRRRVRAPQSIITDSTSEAPSSVVSPLSPEVVAELEAVGLHVDPERVPTADEVDAVVRGLAGMRVDEPSMAMERVDTDSALTSPIAPPGAPSVAGSLFSRVASPKPIPTRARLGAVRVSATPSSTPAKSTAAAPGSSVRARRRPESIPAPASVASTAPEVKPESLFSSGANMRRSADPNQMPMSRTRSVFSRGPGSVASAGSAPKPALGLLNHLKSAGIKPLQNPSQASSSMSSRAAKKTQNTQKAPASVSDDFDGGLTSSEEEDGDDDEASEAGTATADDDGLDHLTESVEEPFGLQPDPSPEQSPVVEKQPKPLPISTSSQQKVKEKATSPDFEGNIVDQPLTVSPQLMPTANPALLQSIEGEESMPDEVLALNPIICDACHAPMPLAKWAEHIEKSSHRRNAARYSQHLFEQIPADSNRDTRERWAEAMHIKPRPARSSEYAFCDVCAVFLHKGDLEHFQGKKHYRCVRAAALNDADELESVRGSVSDEEDGPSARAMRAAAAATSGSLGQQVFPRVENSTQQ
ncbi:hypothetical protein RhiJN_10602 [Ceratobasidium sp. AG-Ba]|nr:hypothetical protein RhiJN_10602 [Ceratobasidium sp. AG-Ba]